MNLQPALPAGASTLRLDLSPQRVARVAERRAFVEMKQCFMQAVATVPGAVGDSLRWKVRQAVAPTDLWRLRRAVLALLSPTDPHHAEQRRELRRHLDSAYPGVDDTTSFVAL